jgi:hypothetical protein
MAFLEPNPLAPDPRSCPNIPHGAAGAGAVERARRRERAELLPRDCEPDARGPSVLAIEANGSSTAFMAGHHGKSCMFLGDAKRTWTSYAIHCGDWARAPLTRSTQMR